jgi:RHS repeat-associated protein
MPFADATGQNVQPYKYNGKELDGKNGLNMYDYSARYLALDFPGFGTVDPLATLDYNWSPYAYVDNNPLRWVDPTGMKKGDPDDPIELNEVVVTPQKSTSPIIFWSTLFKIGYQIMATSDMTYYSYNKGTDNFLPIVNDLMVTYEFATGTGPQKREFGPENRSTYSLKKSHLTKAALARIRILMNLGQTKGMVDVGFNPLEGHDSGPFSELWHDNIKYNTAQFTGSARYYYEVVGDKINITVANQTSLRSALYHIPFVGEPSRSETPLGIGGNVEQSYTFSIPLTDLK